MPRELQPVDAFIRERENLDARRWENERAQYDSEQVDRSTTWPIRFRRLSPAFRKMYAE